MKLTFLSNLLLPVLLLTILMPSLAQTVQINELMADNKATLSDTNGKYSDWIELYNPTKSNINLKGWFLTDDKQEPKKWTFPNVAIAAESYLIVFASGDDTKLSNGEIHTNFKLSSDGEYLALSTSTGTIVSQIEPGFSALKEDESFGWMYNSWVTFNDPTPGAANSTSTGAQLPLPVFSKAHGFYTAAFQLAIDPQLQNTTVYYTTNGSEPTTNDSLYNAPLTINGTTVVRAKSFSPDGASSKTYTQTYLFVDDIIHQNNTPEGYPEFWGEYVGIKGTAVADYEMDPELIADPAMAQRVKDALLSLPVMSFVSNKDNFFSRVEDEETGGIYVFTAPPGREIGKGWERPASVEYFDANSNESFQIDCGIQLHGGHSRRPEKAPKHSFRLNFKSKYGPSRLEFPLFKDTHIQSFNSIVLRAGFGNSWTHWTSEERDRAQYGRDTWSKDTQREMGYLSSHSKFVHLFINGIYWGIYNPGEKLDGDYAADYMGGDPDDYDIIKDLEEIANGNDEAWNTLFSLANKGVKTDDAYQFVQGNNPDGTRNWDYENYVDVINLMDYMLLNFYGGNTDWDHHNWVAIRKRVNTDKGYQFFAWDQEHVLKSRGENTTGEFNTGCPSNLFQRLAQNPTFKRTFADRVVKYCTTEGVLTPDANKERWMKRSVIIENAIDAEAARWGDYRRDVHPYQESGPFDLYTKDTHWLQARDYLMNSYFPERTDILIDQLRDAGLFPKIDAPYYLLNGKTVYESDITSDDQLTFKASKGTIYYTLDGTDPVDWDGSKGTLSERAIKYTGVIKLDKSAQVNARAQSGSTWSAMRSEAFRMKDNNSDLKITEIHYHPLPGVEESDEYEFIELKNTGSATLNLQGYKFVEGIAYEFTVSTPLAPNQFIVLASNEKQFYNRYQRAAYDGYKGNLDNGGEKLAMVDYAGDTICAIDYKDDKGWPVEADGLGPSIVPVEFNPTKNQNNGLEWRVSYHEGGSPFEDDDLILSSDKETDEFADSFNFHSYPNPFTDEVVFSFQNGNNKNIEINIYNGLGELLQTLSTSGISNGRITWDGKTSNGANVPAGIYIGQLKVDSMVKQNIKLMKIH